MATFREIATTETDPQAPVTSALMKALDDNVDATAEGAVDAPVNSTGWHPYDMVFVGDGNDGLFYDFAVHGAVSSITTPTFVDGYDYLVRFRSLSPSAGGILRMAAASISAGLVAGDAFSGFVEIVAPTLTDWPKVGRLHLRLTAGSNAIAPQSAAAASLFNGEFNFGSLASALTSVSLDFNASANFDAGTAFLYRRRNFMFG